MEYRYKTKSIQERVDLIDKIMIHHSIPVDEMGATLHDIHEEYDWMEYPCVLFSTSSVGEVKLDLTPSGKNTIDDVREFMGLCGLEAPAISYGGLTIPKHKFV
jgi:hypothetical protein